MLKGLFSVVGHVLGRRDTPLLVFNSSEASPILHYYIFALAFGSATFHCLDPPAPSCDLRHAIKLFRLVSANSSGKSVKLLIICRNVSNVILSMISSIPHESNQ